MQLAEVLHIIRTAPERYNTARNALHCRSQRTFTAPDANDCSGDRGRVEGGVL
jgi:hypothetical protein